MSCEMTAREDYNPTGWEGCTIYGAGTASAWGGPGVARNDCLWPWTDCQAITITVRADDRPQCQPAEVGRAITVQPQMFGDLYTRTPDQRLVDLGPAEVNELGLVPECGLWPVTVQPAGAPVVAGGAPLPDTAITLGEAGLWLAGGIVIGMALVLAVLIWATDHYLRG